MKGMKNTCIYLSERGNSMLDLIINKQKERKNILIISGYFAIFMVIYLLLDYLNGGYTQMIMDYGFYLVLLNITLNIIMSIMSAFMLSMSTDLLKMTGKEGKGSNASFLSLFFGIFTYGCTPCLIAFFATFGITLSVAVLPLAGFPYKLLSFILLILGFIYLLHEMKNPKCKLKVEKNDGDKTRS